MKRQVTLGIKLFVKCVSQKRLVTEYIKNSLNKIINNPL